MEYIQLMGCTYHYRHPGPPELWFGMTGFLKSYRSTWKIIPGLGCVANNHGYCSCCTLRIGLWDFCPNGRTPWLLNGGYTNHLPTGMILQVWFCFPPKRNRLWVAFMASRRSGMIVPWQDFSVRENCKVGPKTSYRWVEITPLKVGLFDPRKTE